jgi:uridine phosphorylase
LPYHLGDLKTGAHVAIVTGDPDRVPTLAQALGPPGAPWSRRGFVCLEASYGDEPVLVASTGIGGPTTAIVVEEISQLGISQVIRVGTCGSMQPQVRPGHLVIACGAVRDEGTSHQYLPASVPAVPDPALLACILAEARRVGVPHHVGLTHCKDAYYAERPEGLPLSNEWKAKWTMLRSIGVLATEMEAASLFAVATARRLQAAALLVPIDSTISASQVLGALKMATRIAVGGAQAARLTTEQAAFEEVR